MRLVWEFTPTPLGALPTGTTATTALSPSPTASSSMTETESRGALATYTWPVVGLTATSAGTPLSPTLVVTVLLGPSITETLASPRLATYRRLVARLRPRPPGPGPTVTVATAVPSMRETRLLDVCRT